MCLLGNRKTTSIFTVSIPLYKLRLYVLHKICHENVNWNSLNNMHIHFGCVNLWNVATFWHLRLVCLIWFKELIEVNAIESVLCLVFVVIGTSAFIGFNTLKVSDSWLRIQIENRKLLAILHCVSVEILRTLMKTVQIRESDITK